MTMTRGGFTFSRKAFLLCVITCVVTSLFMLLFMQRWFSKQSLEIIASLYKHEHATLSMTKMAPRIPQQHEEPFDYPTALEFLQKFTKLHNRSQVDGRVNPADPDTLSAWYQAAAIMDFYQHSPPRYKCGNIVPIPGSTWFICQDDKVKIAPPCLVYSFGINWEWQFDDAMGELGCEVHCFDPSMGTKDHKRNANITFHDLGLGANNLDAFHPRKDEYVKDKRNNTMWRVRTVKSIMQMLGHEHRVLDVLKMDVEGYEWAVVDNLLETGVLRHVRQFMLEWHLFYHNNLPPRDEYIYALKVYNKLRSSGFKEFHQVPKPNIYKLQCDSLYINSLFDEKTQLIV